MNTQTKFLTVKDLAARWHVAVCTVRGWSKTRGFPAAYCPGGKIQLFSLDEIVEWETSKRYKPARRSVKRAVPVGYIKPLVRSA